MTGLDQDSMEGCLQETMVDRSLLTAIYYDTGDYL